MIDRYKVKTPPARFYKRAGGVFSITFGEKVSTELSYRRRSLTDEALLFNKQCKHGFYKVKFVFALI